jgi:hypothetical protein
VTIITVGRADGALRFPTAPDQALIADPAADLCDRTATATVM